MFKKTEIEDILAKIRKDLKENSDEKTRQSSQRFFKETVKCHGIKTATVGKIAKKYWTEIKNSDKKEIFYLCEELYKSDFTEEAFIVSFWLPNAVDRFEKSDLEIFRGWIDRYINNWAKCDGFCNHTMGDFMEKFPDLIPELKKWAKSKNRWMKRASAVTLIVPAKKGKYLREAIEISDILMQDPDDMVQKGYGWLLKEESRKHQDEILDYVIKNKKIMPRTALRYAIELMSKESRTKAMEK